MDVVEAASFAGSPRLSVNVGKFRNVGGFSGRCVGDDLTWKGSKVIRACALQTAGSGGCLREWGRWWGFALRSFGADVGILTETRIWAEAHHSQAVLGLSEAWFVAVSHNRPPLRQASHNLGGAVGVDPRGGGVLIAVRADHVGSWQDITRDADWRAVAGSLTPGDGQTLRVVGCYGVTGACLPNFTSVRGALEKERRLTECLKQEAQLCDSKGWLCVIGGDLNIFTDASLDRWGGPTTVREECAG